jgi:hypothetical protein
MPELGRVVERNLRVEGDHSPLPHEHEWIDLDE